MLKKTFTFIHFRDYGEQKENKFIFYDKNKIILYYLTCAFLIISHFENNFFYSTFKSIYFEKIRFKKKEKRAVSFKKIYVYTFIRIYVYRYVYTYLENSIKFKLSQSKFGFLYFTKRRFNRQQNFMLCVF